MINKIDLEYYKKNGRYITKGTINSTVKRKSMVQEIRTLYRENKLPGIDNRFRQDLTILVKCPNFENFLMKA